ncbi:MAG: PhnD/SsuA/transferrin family substrate-binding protein [Pseudomonadota bacterium]
MDREIKTLFIAFLMAILMISGCGQTEEAKTEKSTITPPESVEEKVFKLCVQPTTKPLITFDRYQPIVDYLREATKLNIELAVVETYKDFLDLHKQEKIDFVIQDSFSTYLIGQNTPLVPIANVISPQGKLYDPGFIIVKADSAVIKLNDLKGKTFLFGPKASAATFFSPYILLKKTGIDLGKDLTYEHGGLCPDRAMSVFLAEYDASVVCGLYMAQKNKKFNFETDLRVIAETGDWAPYWIVSCLKKTDKAVADKVKQALLELDMENPKTSDVFSVCKWKGFTRYSDEISKIASLAKEYSVPN